MKLLRLKLPKIKNIRKLQSDEKENSFIKLTPKYREKTYKVIRIPKNIRTINYNNYMSLKNSISKMDTSREKNESIKSFLIKNISVNTNLTPKYNLKKIITTKHFRKIPKFIPNIEKEKIFNRKNKSKTNDMNLFLFKLDKMLGLNNGLKRVNDISKPLCKDRDTPTNGNQLYSDSEEEKKESITFYIDKNNNKTLIKKNLTRKIKIKQKILNLKPKIEDNFHIKCTSFTPYGLHNIRKIKYLENMAKEKLKHNNTPKVTNYFLKSQSKKEKFKSVLRKKIRNLGNEMIQNKSYMEDINKKIESCIEKARNKLEIITKEIEKEYSNDII